MGSRPPRARHWLSSEPLCRSLEAHCSQAGTQMDADTDRGSCWRPWKCPGERVADVQGQREDAAGGVTKEGVLQADCEGSGGLLGGVGSVEKGVRPRGPCVQA